MSDADEALTKAVRDKIDGDLAKMREKYEKELDDKIRRMEERVEGELKRRVMSVGIAVVGAVVLGILLAVLGWTAQVNGAVIALQKDLIAAQTVIRLSSNELTEQGNKLRDAQGKAENDLRKTQADLDIAKKVLLDTKAEYESRLQSLRPTPAPKR